MVGENGAPIVVPLGVVGVHFFVLKCKAKGQVSHVAKSHDLQEVGIYA